MASDDPADGVDPAEVTAVRTGNALAPGLMAFTGVSFLAYLLTKAATGMVPVDAGWATQVAVSAALLGFGGWRIARARYFYVEIETRAGRRRFKGLSKAQQTRLAQRLTPPSA